VSVQIWEHFFKPETRSSGRSLFSQGKVSIQQPSDIEVVVYVRVSPPLKVSLKTESMSSNTLIVDCNCPAGKKGLFCKHIWAGLLATEQKNPDFFESKTEIEKKEASSKSTAPAKPTEKSQAFEAKQAEYKEKQATYRKEQYQKQKQRLKDIKQNNKDKKNQPEKIEFPREIEKALSFFSQNGIELRESLNKELVGSAKKKLARIFHPDLGGSHDEILELNKYADILTEFISQKQT